MVSRTSAGKRSGAPREIAQDPRRRCVPIRPPALSACSIRLAAVSRPSLGASSSRARSAKTVPRVPSRFRRITSGLTVRPAAISAMAAAAVPVAWTMAGSPAIRHASRRPRVRAPEPCPRETSRPGRACAWRRRARSRTRTDCACAAWSTSHPRLLRLPDLVLHEQADVARDLAEARGVDATRREDAPPADRDACATAPPDSRARATRARRRATAKPSSPSAASVPVAPPNCSSSPSRHASAQPRPAALDASGPCRHLQPEGDRRGGCRSVRPSMIVPACSSEIRSQCLLQRARDRRESRDTPVDLQHQSRNRRCPGSSRRSGRRRMHPDRPLATRSVSALTSGIATVPETTGTPGDGLPDRRARPWRSARSPPPPTAESRPASASARASAASTRSIARSERAIRKQLGQRVGRRETVDEERAHARSSRREEHGFVFSLKMDVEPPRRRSSGSGDAISVRRRSSGTQASTGSSASPASPSK